MAVVFKPQKWQLLKSKLKQQFIPHEQWFHKWIIEIKAYTKQLVNHITTNEGFWHPAGPTKVRSRTASRRFVRKPPDAACGQDRPQGTVPLVGWMRPATINHLVGWTIQNLWVLSGMNKTFRVHMIHNPKSMQKAQRFFGLMSSHDIQPWIDNPVSKQFLVM